MFLFNFIAVNYCKRYYLGSTLDEYLNFHKTAEAQAESAALGALITKKCWRTNEPTCVVTIKTVTM